MKDHVPYNENNLKHQEPMHAISQWQENNDFDGLEEEDDEVVKVCREIRREAQEMSPEEKKRARQRALDIAYADRPKTCLYCRRKQEDVHPMSGCWANPHGHFFSNWPGPGEGWRPEK